MNRKWVIASTLLVAAFIALTAYKTKEQQQQEIASAIAAKLDEYRMLKQEECTARINTEARRRFDEYVASLPPVSSKPGARVKPKKTAPKSSPSVTPMPQTPPQDPQKQRGGAVQEGNVEQQKQRGGAVQQGDVEQQKKRGGAIKVEGGNN